ncbi:MAG: conjugative transposon protein TraN [Carboxylicivirga sp.]|jgi:hypothetical protein|nr:conjugative transposon protein TraN [Carboxylicivirga sp.]
MKTQILLLLALVLTININAQNHIQVSEHTAVHLICPAAVSYIQVGSHTKLLAEAIPEHPHIVRIKAIEAFKDTSSLTLLCANKLYAFQVSYNSHCPLQLKLYNYRGDEIKEQPGTSLPLHQMLACMHQLQLNNTGKKSIQSTKTNRIELTLNEIRVRKDLLFVKLTIKNHSNQIYKAEAPTFLMRDKKPKKAANVQEYKLQPVRLSASNLSVQPGEKTSIVVVLNSFSIPKHKQVEITLLEETAGYTGRDLSLSFGNKAIIKAKAL